MLTRSWVRNVFTRRVTRPSRKAPQRFRLALEALEDRTLLATFTVLNGDDAGAGSLREAIAPANDEVANPGPDTIDFAPDVTAVTLTTDQLTISSDVSITGPATKVTIARDTAAPEFRIFEVGSGASAALSGMTITGGVASGPVPAIGGGLLNNGTVTLDNCTVSGNSAFGPFGTPSGGGLFNIGDSATAALTNCTVTGNSAFYLGGGLYNGHYSTLTLTNCTVSGNSAFSGGGMSNFFSDSSSE